MTTQTDPVCNYVISAINLVSGGPLTVLNSILSSLLIKSTDKVNFYVFTSRASALDKDLRKIAGLHIIEVPWACRNLFVRLYFEYVYLYFWSRSRDIYLWLSLNDVTPNVVAKRRVAYFHNPSPFSPFKQMVVKHPLFVLYGLLYNLVYLINIKKNNLVVVQQNWIARIVSKRYRPSHVLTALPMETKKNEISIEIQKKIDNKPRFCFPAFPRFFKNYQVIGDAVNLLNNMGYTDFLVTFTLKGNENKYSKTIKKMYGHLSQIEFVGLLSRAEMHKLYSQTQVLIFPSILETWGLPITEFKAYGKPMLVAERPYARETVGHYPYVCFFDPFNSQELAKLMANVIDDTIVYTGADVDEIYDCYDYDSLAIRILSL